MKVFLSGYGKMGRMLEEPVRRVPAQDTPAADDTSETTETEGTDR